MIKKVKALKQRMYNDVEFLTTLTPTEVTTTLNL